MQTIDKPLQFGIRHLLEAMFVVSLMAALFAPWVRGWSTGQWLALGLQTGIIALTIALSLGYNLWARRATCRYLGPIHFRVRFKTWGQSGWWRGRVYLPLGFATFLLLLLTAAIASGPRQGPHFIPFVPIVFAGLLAAAGVSQLLFRPDEMLIGQRGMAISGWQFVPWEQVSFAYERDHRAAPFFLKITGWAFELQSPPEVEQALAAFFAEHVATWPNPPQRRKIQHS